MPLSCPDGDQAGWHHTIARFTPVSIAGKLVLRVLAVILPKDRDPRFVTICRGGTLTAPTRITSSWPVGGIVRRARPRPVRVSSAADPRPRQAIEQARVWARGEITMSQARTAGDHAMAAARDLSGAARHAAYAAGHAEVVAHIAAHELGAAAYAIKASRAAAPAERARAQGDSSAGGSATSSRRRFASSYSTTSGCEMTSAGRCSTAESASGRQHCPTSASVRASARTTAWPLPSSPRFSLRQRVAGSLFCYAGSRRWSW